MNKMAGEPVDVLVNGKLIARGEVVVIDESFGIRVTEVVSKAERIRSMGGVILPFMRYTLIDNLVATKHPRRA